MPALNGYSGSGVGIPWRDWRGDWRGDGPWQAGECWARQDCVCKVGRSWLSWVSRGEVGEGEGGVCMNGSHGGELERRSSGREYRRCTSGAPTSFLGEHGNWE